MKCVAVFTTLLLGLSLTFATFPNEFKRCNRTDKNVDECLSDAKTDVIKKLAEPKYGFPDLEPFTFERLPIYSSKWSGLVVPGEFFNYEIHGMTTSNFTTEAKLLGCAQHRVSVTLKVCNRLQILLTFPKLEHKFSRCKFNGDLMEHSIRGEGSGSAISTNTRILYVLQFFANAEENPYNEVEIVTEQMGTMDEVEYNFDSFEGDMSAEELTQWLSECECSREFLQLATEGIMYWLSDKLRLILLNLFSKVSVDELW